MTLLSILIHLLALWLAIDLGRLMTIGASDRTCGWYAVGMVAAFVSAIIVGQYACTGWLQ